MVVRHTGGYVGAEYGGHITIAAKCPSACVLSGEEIMR